MNPAVLKRIVSLLLCLLMIASCLTALAETTKVSAYLLRLRATPSLKGKVLDAYPRGTQVTILKKGDEWTKVKVHGKVGYMKTSMLAYSRKSADGKSGTSGSTMYVAKGIRLYLRDSASTSGEILGSYRGGTAVTVLKKGKYWTQVSVGGKTGYMGTEYLVAEKEK